MHLAFYCLRVLRLAYPLILASMTIPLLGAVDTAVLGRLGDAGYLAAMAIGVTIFSYFLFGFNFLRTGTTGLSSQEFGGGDSDECMRILYRALFLAIFLGFVLLVFFRVPILWLSHIFFPVSDSVRGFVDEYYNIRILSSPASLVNLVLIGWFLGQGRGLLTLLVHLVINLLNIVLDFYLVLGLGFAIAGAAWATVIAEYSGMVLGLSLAFGWLGRGHLRQALRFIFDKQKFRMLLGFNFNIMVRTFLLLTCLAWFTAQGAHLGEMTLAINAVLMNFFTFAAFGLDGIADATQSLTGQEYGRRNKRGLRLVIRAAFLINVCLACLASLLYWFGFSGIVSLLTDIESVREGAEEYAIWVILLPLTGVWCFVLDGVFIGLTLGRALRNAMIIASFIYFSFGWILVSHYDNHGLWLALNLFLLLRAIFLWLYYPRHDL